MRAYLDATFWMSVLTLLAGFMAASWVLQADLRRRRMHANPFMIVFLTGAIGFAVAYFNSQIGLAWFSGLLGGFFTLLVLARGKAFPLLEFLDACAPAAASGYAAVMIGKLFYVVTVSPSSAGIPPMPLYESFIWLAIAAFLWRMGTRATLTPKAGGEIFSIYLLLMGAAKFLTEFLLPRPPGFPRFLTGADLGNLTTFLAGGILLGYVLIRFHALSKEHRILQHATARGDVLQPEYHRPTPECPHPERWHMYDSMTAEVEVLDFLKALITTIKPELVVETGTFLGSSTLRIAEGLRENGFGRIITCENDAKVFEEAKKRFQDSGLADWIDLRNESSLETRIEGRIDLLYCDSDLPLREQEVRRFLPQVNPNGLILMHDASSNLKTVREAAQRLEREGLLSIVLLPTPRGLVLAQKRERRS